MPVMPRIFGGPQTAPVVPSWFDPFTAAEYDALDDLHCAWQLETRYHVLWLPLDTYPGIGLNQLQLAVPIFNSVIGTGVTLPLPATSRLRLRCVSQAAPGGPLAAGETWFLGMFFVPKIWGADLNGKNQFAEIQTIADTSSAGNMRMRYGVSVLAAQGANPGGSAAFGACGYTVLCDALTGNAFLCRGISASPTDIPGGAVIASCAFAIGDLVYIDVTVAAGSNTVHVKINGVTQITFVDVIAQRPRAIGLPAICFYAQVGDVQATLTNFRAGPL